MASRNIRRIIELILDPRSANKAERDMQAALKKGTDSKDAQQNLTGIERSIQRVKVAAVALTATLVAALATGLRKVVGESSESQRVHAQLEQAIRSTGGAARLTARELQAHADALQKVTTFSDEAVAGAQALLLTFTQIRGGTFKSATETVLDMSQALGQDLKSSAIQVGKALNDPIKGVTALQRVGVSFTESQKGVIASLVKTGELEQAQALILKELQVEFGGSAVAARDTLGGALQGLSNAWNELFEVSRDSSRGVIGAINALTRALPSAREKADAFFTDFIEGFRQAKLGTARLWEGLGDIGDRLAKHIPVVQKWADAWHKAGEEMRAAAFNRERMGRHERTPGGGGGGSDGDLTLPKEPTLLDPLLVDIGMLGQRRNAGFEAAKEEFHNRARSLLGVSAAGVTQGAPEGRISDDFDALVDYFRSGFEDVESSAQTAALGIEHAFQGAFESLFEDGADFGSFMEAIFRGTAAAGLTAIAQYATGKVVEDVAHAFDERAAAAAEVALAASNPFLAAQHLAAAAAHTAASHGWILGAAKWALAGGAASGAAAAVGGGGGAGGFRGDDVTGRAIDRLDQTAPIVNVYVDGIDPDNPAHVALMQRTVVNAREQWGDQKPTVRRYSRSSVA